MRWLHILLAVAGIATLAAFADPLEVARPTPVGKVGSPSSLEAALAAEPLPATGKISPISSNGVSPVENEDRTKPAVATIPSSLNSSRQVDLRNLRLPGRSEGTMESFSEEPAEGAVQKLAHDLHVNILYSGDPGARFSAAAVAGESVEKYLQRVFASSRFRLTRSGELFEVRTISPSSLRRVSWSEILGRRP